MRTATARATDCTLAGRPSIGVLLVATMAIYHYLNEGSQCQEKWRLDPVDSHHLRVMFAI
jgi:hypothetical protein